MDTPSKYHQSNAVELTAPIFGPSKDACEVVTTGTEPVVVVLGIESPLALQTSEPRTCDARMARKRATRAIGDVGGVSSCKGKRHAYI